MKKFICLLLFFTSLASSASASSFQKNLQLIETLKENKVRVVVLCNFQGSNNVLDIVTSSRSPGYELTNLGQAKLNDTIPALIPLNITRIYTAPAFRALQTTNQLGKAFNLTPKQLTVDTRLGMQNFGNAEGEDYDLYKQRFTSLQDMLEGTPENGESGLSVFTRTQDFLTSLENLENQTVLIISHAFNFCHISKCLTGKYKEVPAPGTFVIYDFKPNLRP